MKQHNSFYQLIKALSSRDFLIKYYLKVKFFQDIMHVEAYQDICRIYLDEHQEERNLFMENRFLRRK